MPSVKTDNSTISSSTKASSSSSNNYISAEVIARMPAAILMRWLCYIFDLTGQWLLPPQTQASAQDWPAADTDTGIEVAYEEARQQHQAHILSPQEEEQQPQIAYQIPFVSMLGVAPNQQAQSPGKNKSTGFDYAASPYFTQAEEIISQHATMPISPRLIFGCKLLLALVIAWCNFPLFSRIGGRQGQWMSLSFDRIGRELKLRAKVLKECLAELQRVGILLPSRVEGIGIGEGEGEGGPNLPGAISREELERLRYDVGRLSEELGGGDDGFWRPRSIQEKNNIYRLKVGGTRTRPSQSGQNGQSAGNNALEFNPFSSSNLTNTLREGRDKELGDMTPTGPEGRGKTWKDLATTSPLPNLGQSRIGKDVEYTSQLGELEPEGRLVVEEGLKGTNNVLPEEGNKFACINGNYESEVVEVKAWREPTNEFRNFANKPGDTNPYSQSQADGGAKVIPVAAASSQSSSSLKSEHNQAQTTQSPLHQSPLHQAKEEPDQPQTLVEAKPERGGTKDQARTQGGKDKKYYPRLTPSMEHSMIEELGSEQKALFDFFSSCRFEGWEERPGQAGMDNTGALMLAVLKGLTLQKAKERYEQANQMYEAGECKSGPIRTLIASVRDDKDYRSPAISSSKRQLELFAQRSNRRADYYRKSRTETETEGDNHNEPERGRSGSPNVGGYGSREKDQEQDQGRGRGRYIPTTTASNGYEGGQYKRRKYTDEEIDASFARANAHLPPL